MCAVTVGTHILRTKLYPPRLPEIVVRERLLEELEKARSAKLTTIIAGAGYGKSTLVAEFLQKLGNPFVWYQLESTDSDLSEFLSYLVAGLRGIHPEFGEKTLSYMGSVANAREQSRAILSTLITELDELIGEELFIALDDFHLVNESVAITEAIGFLLDHMLPNLHFMILSRSELNLTLTRLRANRELLELKEDDLCFTPGETAVLFKQVFGMPLGEEDIAALSLSTEGWISGLVLFYLALKGRTGERISAAIRELGPPSAISDYLSKAVYENQSETLRDFLAKTSILSRMNPDFCGELLGISDAWVLLSHLSEARLFTIPLDDRGVWYRYHHCLGAFLQKTLKESCSSSQLKDLHLRAAALWQKSGEPEEAFFHYMEAQDYEKASGVLDGIAGQLMRSNRVSFLDGALSSLPEDVLQDHPRLMLYGTQIASLVGDYNRVLAAARGAVQEFEKMGDRDMQAQSLLGLAEAFIVVGRFEEAEETSTKAREVMPPESPFRYKAMAVEGMLQVLLGRTGKAGRLLEEAASGTSGIDSVGLRSTVLTWCGFAWFLQGRFGNAVEALVDADSLPEDAGLTHTHAYLYPVLSRIFAYLDRLDEARLTADRGLELSERHGLAPLGLFCRAARAVAWAYQGEEERALYDMSIAASLCEKYETFAEVLDIEPFLGEVYGLSGDKEEALKHWRRFERIVVAPFRDTGYFTRAGMVACSAGDLGPEGAALETAKVLTDVGERKSTLALSYTYSLLMSLKVAAGKNDEAREVLEAYIADFGPDIIMRTYTTETEYLVRFFSDLFLEGKHLEFMGRVFSLGGKRSAPYLARLQKHANAQVAAKAGELLETISRQAIDPLAILMLGRLEVSRGGRVLSAADWKSKKALTVFKYLAAHREKGFIPRDVLIDLLWPDAPLDAAARNLNVALTSLRKTLEPEASRGESSYLVSKGDSLRLELGARGWTDLELFREKLAVAAKAREVGDFDLYFRALKEAAELYRGDFCSEDLYEDWCFQEREELRGEYIKALVNMATEHLRRGEEEEALACLERAISMDPGREELYRKQMIIHSQMGNRAGAVTAFKRCVKYLEENFDVSPSAETVDLYNRLLGQ